MHIAAGVKRVKLRAMLRDKLDGSYETQADVKYRRPGI
jgi:hypothetical protein